MHSPRPGRTCLTLHGSPRCKVWIQGKAIDSNISPICIGHIPLVLDNISQMSCIGKVIDDNRNDWNSTIASRTFCPLNSSYLSLHKKCWQSKQGLTIFESISICSVHWPAMGWAMQEKTPPPWMKLRKFWLCCKMQKLLGGSIANHIRHFNHCHFHTLDRWMDFCLEK